MNIGYKLEDIEKEKKKLYEFCSKCDCFYLYGAGYWAGKLYELLNKKGITPLGFVVTDPGDMKEYLGQTVIKAKDLSGIVPKGKDVHILVAFDCSDVREISEILGEENYVFHQIPLEVMGWLVNEDKYFHFTDVLNENIRDGKDSSFEIGNKANKILIIRLDVIGDLVCSTALIREIRANYQDAEITLIVNENFAGIFEECPYIDKLIGYKCQKDGGNLYDRLKDTDLTAEHVNSFIEEYKLANEKYDMAILPRALMTGSSCVDELMLVMRCSCNRRIAHMIDMKSSEFEVVQYGLLKRFFAHLILQYTEMHETGYQMDMLEKCNLLISDRSNELWVSEKKATQADRILSEYGSGKKFICVGTVGSKPVKNWSKENFRKWINLVEEKFNDYFCFLLLGGDDAIEAAEYIAGTDKNCINLAGKTNIALTVALIDRCEIYVGIDTGLMHIADALGKPSIALFHSLPDRKGITSYGPIRWGAHTKGSVIIEPERGLDGCSMYCRKEYAHCVNTITPEQVLYYFMSLAENMIYK